MSDSKKFLAPAAVAAALTAVLVPTEAHAKKKEDCDIYKPDTTVEESDSKSSSVTAKVTGAGGGGASGSKETTRKKETLPPEVLKMQTVMFGECERYNRGLLPQEKWDARVEQYNTLLMGGTAATPATPAAPATGAVPPPPTNESSTSTAPAKEAKGGGGGGKGGLIVGIVAAVAVVVVVIATIAHFSDGSGKDEESELGGDTGTAMIVAPDQASIAIV